MDARLPNAVKCWLSALLLAALLGAQVLQAAHVHADHVSGPDCVQCKLDSGHALLSQPQSGAPMLAAAAAPFSQVPAAPICSPYRLPARGPPAISS